MRTLFGFFRRPLVLLTLGALCVALLVWFAGPLLAFADWHPLESVLARVVFIVLLLGLWLGGRVYRALREKIRNRRLVEDLAARERVEAPPADAAQAAQLETVRKRFVEALAVMREARPGARTGLAARLFGGRRYVYQLPWYVFIGPPGSGKTTALLNSGLQFPLAERLGSDPIRGIGGTRDCDWWFTDQAVMIDTAGRYTTQDSDASADAREWTEFLKLLKKHRPRQPINGALVTVSVSDLLQLPPAEREQQAMAVRNRVNELMTSLDNDFPVYLLITKADLIGGFMEFFGDFDRESREQVWGSTFEHRDPPEGVARPDFEARFDELVARIDALTLDRLQSERDPQRRAAIFGFAHQLATVRAALADFVSTAFPASKLARQPMLRGFYFTSGTQEGNPIDRVMGSLARQFGLQRRMLPALRPSGKSFFLTRLLHGVIFPEAGLAGTNLRWERRAGTLKWAASIAAMVLAAGAVLAWSYSFYNNRSYVDTVAAKVAALKNTLAGTVASAIPLRALLPLYSTVKSLPFTEDVDPEHPRLSYGWGLFQGGKLAEASRQAYHRLLEQTLAPLLANRIAAVLRRGAGNPELQYETLKTYVMLITPEHLDPAAVKGWVAFDLDTNFASDFTPEQRREMLGHVEALLARNGVQDAVTIDTDLIAQSRAALTRTPFPQRVYDRVRRQGVGDFPDFRITAAGGPSAAVVFTRTSGRSLNEGVPGIFTYDGYHKGFSKALDEVIRDLAAEEVWVLGIKDSENARRAADAAGRQELTDDVKRLYLNDYASTWERFVADISVVRGNDLSQTIQSAKLLSAPDSPLPRLLRAIVREVSLTESETRTAVDKAVEKAASAVKDTKDTLSRLLGPAATDAAARAVQGQGGRIESIVDDRFDALRRTVRAPASGGPAPIDQTVALINDFYMLMTATDTAVKSGGPPPASDVPARIKSEAGRLPEPLRAMLGGLAASGSSQAQGATRENISRALKTSITEFCTKAVANRFPFVRDGKDDVTPDDFARLFAPGGLMDDFFQKNLAAYVDTTVKPWKFRQLSDVSMGDSKALIEFQRAAEIRNVFFGGGGRDIALRIEMKPLEMDPAILQFSLDVDGQVLRYAHGPSVPQSIQWPGPKKTNQIRIQVSPPGASGSSGLVFEGPWALFRMFARAQIEQGSQPEKFRASFAIDDRRIQFDVTTASVQNPFRLNELQAFRCPTGL
ncbi:MAG TPA: type VI secretion system membrane subunit TssM [Quisquiliibacterium sp.]|nr:type VI secretion system membrane subunit TssM [Quisquiliibacterium sp.]HQN12966.1 type VI secretion system membrane subunit TssM [Quisquiliibacterium sp.]